MSVSLDRGTTIGRLRLRAATADPHALRMRGGTAVGALDLQPPAMPEQAILCIRTLHDPMPGGLDLRFSTAPRPLAWETAMRGAVSDALRRAARPALGPVPANADAVLFADRAELLACAARDALRGMLASHWWWTHLLGGEHSPAAVVREWTRAPAYVPAAVELLAARGEIVAFTRVIAPTETVRLLDAVLRTHALPALSSRIISILNPGISPPPAPEPQYPSPPKHSPRTEAPATPPWRAVVPNFSLQELTVEQQTFVAIALVLRRAPALVRSERFAEEAAAWIASERWNERRRDLPVTIRPMEPKGTEPARVTALHEDSGESGEAPPAGPEPRAPEPRRPVPRRLDSREPARNVSIATAQKTDRPAEPRLDAAPESAPQEPSRPLDVDEFPAPDVARTPEITASFADPEAAEPPPRPDLAVDSDFAGVFFLLNVAIALGLYSDFTSPVQCGIELDIWDFLALTGPALAEIPDFERDPIGPFLAALANRKDGEPPGAGFVPPEENATSPPGRVRVRSLSRWLDETVLRMRERLALAGLEDPPRIVRRYGRVTTTPAHLDVYFSLAAHPIEIRMAGLDRDPGWIPAAGRHVAFHFA